jgi:RND family efflux transporter MFP subunit
MKRCAGVALLGLLASAPGCEPPQAANAQQKPKPPVKVEKTAKEDALGTITLTPEAEKRLGVELAEVKREAVARVRSYAGDVIVPPGQLIVVSAPFIGTIVPPDGGMPAPGSTVRKGQTVLSLLPILAPEAKATMAQARVRSEGQVEQAKKQLEQAVLNLKRVQNLQRQGTPVAKAAIEDAQNQHAIAETAVKAAEAERSLLEQTIKEAGIGSANPMPIRAPEDGILRSEQALANQQVAAGAILFDVEKVDPAWVRVPVFVDDVPLLAEDRPARIGTLADPTGPSSIAANPAQAPPVGDPVALTVDFTYVVPNPKHALRPGQKVGVAIPMKGDESALVVPRSAVYYDIQGGAWIYEQVKEHTYVRRRVELERIAGERAVLGRGPKPGTTIMTVGVAEVYGTEFGFAK